MRQHVQPQPSLTGPAVDHAHARELDGIGRILRENPGIGELVLQDLAAGVEAGRGRAGMSAEQVLGAAILKQLNSFSYEELSFRLADSWTYRTFCGFGCFDPVPGRATLQRNIKKITEATWQRINRLLLAHAEAQGIEDGGRVRVDATVTSSNVHAPTDSSLLWDSVRVLTRLMTRAQETFSVCRYPNRTRRARRRALEVLNARRNRTRVKAYRDLLRVSVETVGYAEAAAEELDAHVVDPRALALAAEIRHYLPLVRAVIDQTERRVLCDESVAADEKILSIFEDHTDVIVKDRRATYYGHKLTLTSGRSGLILDWVVEDGNPADARLALRMLERQQDIYGRVPRQAAFDGGYASRANLRDAKALGVQDVAFSKKRGLEVLDMVSSHRLYRRLRNFRAGIESWISFLKRCFGLDRCLWRGWAGFARYVGASIVSANLLTLARRLT